MDIYRELSEDDDEEICDICTSRNCLNCSEYKKMKEEVKEQKK